MRRLRAVTCLNLPERDMCLRGSITRREEGRFPDLGPSSQDGAGQQTAYCCALEQGELHIVTARLLCSLPTPQLVP